MEPDIGGLGTQFKFFKFGPQVYRICRIKCYPLSAGKCIPLEEFDWSERNDFLVSTSSIQSVSLRNCNSIKGTVSDISSKPPSKDGDVQFKQCKPFTALFHQV